MKIRIRTIDFPPSVSPPPTLGLGESMSCPDWMQLVLDAAQENGAGPDARARHARLHAEIEESKSATSLSISEDDWRHLKKCVENAGVIPQIGRIVVPFDTAILSAESHEKEVDK